MHRGHLNPAASQDELELISAD